MTTTIDDLSLLLVEPSTAQRMILLKQLQDVGVKDVRAVSTVQSALSEARSTTPHLIISAMHLPDGKANDLLYQIREEEELEETAYILLSSETRIDELEPIKQGGVVAIVKKPCTKTELLEALNDTLDLFTPEVVELEEQDVEDLRALVVDDSKTARRFIKKVLGQLGIETITEAADGTEAVEILQASFFDIVFTDYNMPQMDGQALLEFIRTKSSQPSVPVVMITSERDETRIAAVEQTGVSAMVDKPFEINQVRAILEGVFKDGDQ